MSSSSSTQPPTKTSLPTNFQSQNFRQISSFKNIKTIAEGTYGKVFVAFDTQNEKVVALKMMKSDFSSINANSENEIIFPKELQHEISILQNLKPNKHIVKLKEIIVSKYTENIFFSFLKLLLSELSQYQYLLNQ